MVTSERDIGDSSTTSHSDGLPSWHDNGEVGDPGGQLHRRHPISGDAGPWPARSTSRDVAPKRSAEGPGAEPLPLDLTGVEVDVEEVVRETVQQLTLHWSAPMPDPGTLAQYEQVLPGAAERILRAFESTTVDASKRDDEITGAVVWVRRTGAGWAFLLLFGCFTAAVTFFALGNPAAGAAFIGAPVLIGIVSMLTTFGRKATTRDDERD